MTGDSAGRLDQDVACTWACGKIPRRVTLRDFHADGLVRVLLSTIGSRATSSRWWRWRGAEGARPGGSPVRAARFSRMDRGARDSRHADRSRAAQAHGRESAGHRRARRRRNSVGRWRRDGRHAVRDDRARPPKVRHDRRRDRAADRRASVAEKLGIPYVFVAYCPGVLPSPHHAPIPLGDAWQTAGAGDADNRELWARDAERFNDTVRRRAQRASGIASAWRRSAMCAATSSPTGHGSPPIRRWRPGPIPRTRPCFRPAPGSCPMSGRFPRAGDVSRRRRAAHLLRLWQHARAAGPGRR